MLKNNGFHNRHSPILRAFSPASLFSGGAPGAWYDPSDLTTLFQDSAGTTPVTAVEQPVGLMLDKSQGLVLGSELVVNGDFTSAAGWTLPGTGTNSITGGKAVLSGASGYLYRTNTSITAGRWYRVQFTVSGYSGSGTARPYLQASPVFGTNVTGNGTFSQYLLATTTSSNTEVGLNFAGAFTASIDDVSIKELPGNHAFQATSASRPVLSARYNQFTKTEDFADSVWTKATVVPIGAGVLKEDTSSNIHQMYRQTSFAANLPIALSVKLSAGTRRYVQVMLNSGSNNLGVTVDTTNWAITNTVTDATWTVTSSATLVLNLDGTRTVTLYGSCTVADPYFVICGSLNATGVMRPTYVGTEATIATSGVDVRASNNGITQPPYQRVNTATDYNTTGFLPYLKFDGVDDSLSTNSINFTSTDKMSVFAGVRKLSDAAYGALAEFSNNADTSSGAFVIWAPLVSKYQWQSRGTNTSGASTTSTTYNAPVTNTLTGLGDISGDRATLRLNGAQVGQSTADQGTGNYGNYPLYIGRRGGTSFPFNGQLYSMVIVGKSVTAGELSSTETYVNQKTGAY